MQGKVRQTHARARASFLFTIDGDRSLFSDDNVTGTARGESGVEAKGVWERVLGAMRVVVGRANKGARSRRSFVP